MAKVRAEGRKNVVWDPGEANPKQLLFYQSRTLYTAYGGAKGGGKTHAVRIKAVGGALFNPGIKILIMRQTYPAVESNHIEPIKRMVPPELASYNGTTHTMTFTNGSVIRFGHWNGEDSEREYNGQEYDWIFIDEATQFSEEAFRLLGGCLRGVNEIPKRMYLTCNPGGVGHRWVKRLFIDRDYKTNCENPEENENPEDYTMIFATVEDNYHLLRSSPAYLQTLSALPEDVRRAYRYGDWNAVGGNYFKEFRPETHTMKPFKIPAHWLRYRSFDYGLDMFACIWWAVDEDGRCWAYRAYSKKDLIVQEAAAEAKRHTLPGETITVTYAPPDMWSRQKDTGRTMAETFMVNGLPIVKSDNNRVQGHMMMKDMMAPIPLKDPFVRGLFPAGEIPEKLPGLMFFDDHTLEEVVTNIEDIQADEKNPNDCATQPHEITHRVDACRYFCVSRVMRTEAPKPEEDEDDDGELEDYDASMCGGEICEGYLM